MAYTEILFQFILKFISQIVVRINYWLIPKTLDNVYVTNTREMRPITYICNYIWNVVNIFLLQSYFKKNKLNTNKCCL